MSDVAYYRGTRLSEHFTLGEFYSDLTRPPDTAVKELRLLCRRYLEPVRDIYGPIRISSGYRTQSHNSRVGGAPQSYHRYDLTPGRGVAADFTCQRGRPPEWRRTLDRLGPGGLGEYRGFVHVDTRHGQLVRW